MAPYIGQAQTLKRVSAGMEWMETRCASPVDGSVALAGVRIEPRRLPVRLLDTYSILGKAPSFTGFSLRDLASTTHPLAVVNGGATASFSSPIPVGLLVTDGRVVSELSSSSKTLTGVLCFAGGSPTVLSVESYKPGQCSSALQAGPIVVQGGRVAVHANERSTRRAYRRSLAAVDGSGRLILIVTSEVHLYDVAQCLTGALKELDVREALNLDGDSSSGLIIDAPGATSREVGSTSSLIASAIAVLPARATATPSRRK